MSKVQKRHLFRRGLTPKEKKVFDFIQVKLDASDVAPTFEEIRDAFGFASINSVQQYIRQLIQKDYLRHPGGNLKRAVTLAASYRSSPPGLNKQAVTNDFENIIKVPFLGNVAAGKPIEAIEQNEEIDVPASLVRGLNCFALKVQGDSMIEDCICDGDTILVKKQNVAENGQTVVALVNNEATVKVFYRRQDCIELVPRNQTMKPIIVKGEDCEIQGIVTGIIRKVGT